MEKADGNNRCSDVAQGFPIGQWEHQSKGRTSLEDVEDPGAGELPIGPFLGAVEATPRLRWDLDEQS